MSVPSEITGNPTNSNPEQKGVIPFQDGDMVCQTELLKAADTESNVKADDSKQFGPGASLSDIVSKSCLADIKADI